MPTYSSLNSLLNCMGKIGERIFAKRLGYLAETTDLLHHSQMGGRKKKSAIDAVFLLKNFIERNKLAKVSLWLLV